MFQHIDSLVKYIKEFNDLSKRKELLKYAIISEAKQNNDLSEIICRSNADKLAKLHPDIFNQFFTKTPELLLMIGMPAHEIIGGPKKPKEETIKKLSGAKISPKIFEEKQPTELYEFYIRKCNLLKSLYNGNSLEGLRISLQQRCRNIGHATRLLVVKCEN